MGKRGARPQAREQAEAKGVYRPVRHENKSGAGGTQLVKVPAAPKTLQDAGKKTWKKVCVALNNRNILAGEDLEILEEYCVCVDKLAEAKADIERRGLVIIETKETKSGISEYQTENPYVKIHQKYVKMLLDISQRFGFTAGDRVSMGLSVQKGQLNNLKAKYLEGSS